MSTLRQPLVRALIVAIGFAIFLVTFIFFTEPPGLLIGSALGLIVMFLPFGFGRDAAPMSEEPNTSGRNSPPEGTRRSRS